ncbi:MAG: alternative ribosome rescue aminoacyl-tRNA hydrolase ArfB [candidate division KSB1 bacterium]|jgi:ribosome-associated protein|nr:alternative ribosome rescue aminoacyl-tRNA hydrolase ArfB [candidate division KSB1 bacterium]
MSRIKLNDDLIIDAKAITIDFIRSDGPGGQNVNKVSTAAQLRFDTKVLPEDIRGRLQGLHGNRITSGGELIINARRFRTQARNRADALKRLVDILEEAYKRPVERRRKTRPSLKARLRRLREKKRRSEKKTMRRFDPDKY